LDSPSKEITVITMEVPCCQALHMMVRKVLMEISNDKHVVKHYIVRLSSGNLEEWRLKGPNKSMLVYERISHGCH